MAARSFNKFSDITDCEMCCCLCLGPTVLPCGHLFCRQCVRHLMQGGSACPTCGQSIPGPAGKTIRKAMKNLARDLVIEDLVTVRLARQGCVPCHMCPNTNASQVCLDCGIYFCKCCVTDHTSFTGTTSDHILVRLPKCPSGKETDIKESLRKEARLMYDVIGQLTKAKSDVASSINRLHEMERGLTRKIELLAMYATRLTSPDNGLIMTATSFLPRAQRVRDDCQQPQAADKGRPLCYLCNVRQDGGQTKVAAKAQDGDVKMVTKIQDGEEIVEIDLTSHQSADQNQNLPLDPLSLFQDPASTSQECDVIASWSAGDKVESVECKGLTINLDRGPLKMEVLTDYKCLRPGDNVWLAKLVWKNMAQDAERKREMKCLALLTEKDADKKMMLECVLNRLTDRLPHIALRLAKELNTNLLAVDVRLNFVMETAKAQWSESVKLQLRETLSELFGRKLRQCIKVSEVLIHPSKFPRHMQVGHSSPIRTITQLTCNLAVQCTSEISTQGKLATLDLLTCTARRTCIIQPITADDPGHPWSISLLMTSQKQLVMADYSNSMLKVVSLSRPFAVWGIKLDLPPWGVARLQDGTLAVTAANESIFLCDVTADHVFVVSRFHTTRQYKGVGAGLDDTLVVSCCDVPCTIDIVTRCGDLLRTLLTSTCVTDFCCPHFLCVKSGDVLVSDVTCHAVFRVKLATGRLVETLRHPELRRPHQIAVDGAENIYVASEDGSCVLVRSASGQWRRLLYGPHHGDCDCERPVGICLTGSVLLVSWHKRYADCVVIGYEFM